jgi:hypothetical protein
MNIEEYEVVVIVRQDNTNLRQTTFGSVVAASTSDILQDITEALAPRTDERAHDQQTL